MVQITDLFIYPVKSLKGIALEESMTALRGFQYDREWMVTTIAVSYTHLRAHET